MEFFRTSKLAYMQSDLDRKVRRGIASGHLVPVTPRNGIGLDNPIDQVRIYDPNLKVIEGEQSTAAVYKVPEKDIFVVRGTGLNLFIGNSWLEDTPDMLVVVQGSGIVSARYRKRVLLSGDFDSLYAKEGVQTGVLGNVGHVSATHKNTQVTIFGNSRQLDVTRAAQVKLVGNAGRADAFWQGKIEIEGTVQQKYDHGGDGIIMVTPSSDTR
jgi:hypothetical protein